MTEEQLRDLAEAAAYRALPERPNGYDVRIVTEQKLKILTEAIRILSEAGFVCVPAADYSRLYESALDGHDDTLVICETCVAWLDISDQVTATTDDYTGCWKMATRRDRDNHLCRSDRGATLEHARSFHKGSTK